MSDLQKTPDAGLFDRIVSILEQARGNVIRAVNSNMVMGYWLIGREIVQDLQGGEVRAEYGKQVLGDLSKRLFERYGKGFSVTNLRYFRLFYQALTGAEKLHPLAGALAVHRKGSPVGSELSQGFSPQLSWTHYRILMAVEDENARDFYEREAIEGGWNKRTLERHIYTQFYDR